MIANPKPPGVNLVCEFCGRIVVALCTTADGRPYVSLRGLQFLALTKPDQGAVNLRGRCKACNQPFSTVDLDGLVSGIMGGR